MKAVIIIIALILVVLASCTNPVLDTDTVPDDAIGSYAWYESQYGEPDWSDYNAMEGLSLYYWDIWEYAYTFEGVDYYWTRLYIEVNAMGNVLMVNRYDEVAG